ncbi:MAG: FAD-binding oxidoreductase [Deltaproteobacteria bacterium]|nr:FAD-binding oxidoreductase [Deltaproteobacteria bacterium]
MRQVKIFPAETGVSGWLETSPYKNHQFNQEEEILEQYDFVVIGGGYGGFGAAYRLAELNPNASVALFEAIRIGANDSGKNAGFLIDVPHAFGDDDSTHEDKIWCVKLNVNSLNKMRKIIKDNHLGVDWDDCGKYLASYEPKTYKHLDEDAKELESMGVPYEDVEGEALAKRLGTKYYKKALFNPGSALVNPADVLRGMCTVLPKNVHVFEKTPVLDIEDGKPATVILVNGRRIRTKAVIVTTGPFLEEFGFCKNTFCPIISFGALSRVLSPQELEDFKGIAPWGCTAGHTAGTTVRFTKTNRLFVRNGLMYATWYTSSPERIRRSQRLLRKAFDNRFPNHKHVNFEYVWGGMIHLTMNSRPLFGRQGSSLFYAGVGEGAGVAKTFTMGTYLAEWANGIESDVLEYLKNDKKPSWLPPEPFKTVGAEIRLVYETLTAAGEI